MWRHDGDQQRKASRSDPPERISNPKSASPIPSPSISQQRSRDMRATHHQMRIGLVAVMLAGWESLIYKHQAGIHMALDIIDNVRVRITSLDRVAQINDTSTIPLLVPDAAANPDRRRAVVDIAAQLGHADMGDALRIAGNFLLAWQYCKEHSISPSSKDGAAILAQRTPSALIHCGGKNVALAEEVKTLYDERRLEARSRQFSYIKKGLAAPSCHRYA